MRRKTKLLIVLPAFILTILAVVWFWINHRGMNEWEELQAKAIAAGLPLDVKNPYEITLSPEENILLNQEFMAEIEGRVSPPLDRWSEMGFGTARRKQAGRSNPAKGVSCRLADLFDEEISEETAARRLADGTKEIRERLDNLAKVISEYPSRSVVSSSLPDEDGLSFSESFVLKFRMPVVAFSQDAVLGLRLGEIDRALDHIYTIYQMRDLIDKRAAINFLIREAMVATGRQAIFEGLRLQVFKKSDLEKLRGLLRGNRIDEADIISMLQFETLYGVRFLENSNVILEQSKLEARKHGLSHQPDSWLRDTLRFGGPKGLRSKRKSLLVSDHLDILAKQASWADLYTDASPPSPTIYGLPVDSVMDTKYLIGNSRRFVVAGLERISSQRIVEIMVALEIYQIDHGSYPATLADLSDTSLVLSDAIDPLARDFGYRLDVLGRPQVWSIHEKAESKGTAIKLRWQYSEDPKKGRRKKGRKKVRRKHSSR